MMEAVKSNRTSPQPEAHKRMIHRLEGKQVRKLILIVESNLVMILSLELCFVHKLHKWG
jgi:hypothetical protein